MDVPLVVAGSLGIFAAAAHGVVGDRVVVQRLDTATLASSGFGGPRMTKAMIHVTWHLTTVAFLTAACALIVAGSTLDGDAADAVAVVAAAAFTGFAGITVGLGAAYMRSPRRLFRHPGPAVLTATAALAWWGAL